MQTGEYYSKGSAAEKYDFDFFERTEKILRESEAKQEERSRRENERRREEQVRYVKHHNKTATITDKYGKLRVATVALIASVFIVLVGIMVANGETVNSINHDIDDLNDELTMLEQDYEVMKITFDSKMSDAAIEKYATEKLGMQRRENNQTECLRLNNFDSFEDCGNGTSSIFRWGNN